jgi:hypothetical protein
MTMETANVDIWIGSEWGSVREAFLARLHETPVRGSVVVLVPTLDPVSPAGRVAGWIGTALAETGVRVATRQPGDPFDRAPHSDRSIIGVVDLLLDPNPRQVDQLYAMGLWSRFVPRKRKLMMRVTPFLAEEIVENAAVAAPRLLVQVAEWSGQRVLIAATDLIAAEAVGRGLRAIAQPAGDIGLNPWQTELVRIASERGLGVTSGRMIAIDVQRAGPMPPLVAAEFRLIMERVASLLDCAVSVRG